MLCLLGLRQLLIPCPSSHTTWEHACSQRDRDDLNKQVNVVSNVELMGSAGSHAAGAVQLGGPSPAVPHERPVSCQVSDGLGLHSSTELSGWYLRLLAG